MPHWMTGGIQQLNLDHLFDTNTIGANDAPKDVFTKYILYLPGVSLSVFNKNLHSNMEAKCGIHDAGTGKFNSAGSDTTAPMLEFRPFNHTGGGGVASSTAAVVATAAGGNGIPSGEYS